MYIACIIIRIIKYLEVNTICILLGSVWLVTLLVIRSAGCGASSAGAIRSTSLSFNSGWGTPLLASYNKAASRMRRSRGSIPASTSAEFNETVRKTRQMKIMQILLLVAVGACAVASEDEVPPYHKYLQDYNQSKKIVTDISTPPVTKDGPNWDLPSRKRDYIQLVGFVHDMTDGVHLQNTYDDDYYKILNTSVPNSWTNPQQVLDNLVAFISRADKKTQQVRNLVTQYCGTYRRSNVGDVSCDLLVDLEIKKDPKKYKRGAEGLVALGKLSALYVKEPYGPKAHNFDMISFLLTGKSELEELITLVRDAKYAMSPLPPIANVR